MIKRDLSPVAILFFIMLLVGCGHSSQNNSDGRPQAWLEPGIKVTLPEPGITPSISSQQLLTGVFNGETQSLLVMLNADEKKITLAGLSSMGIRLFLATYDENGLSAEQSILVPQLPPASQVLADIMLSYWPVRAWLPQFPKGWTLIDSGDRRELRNADGKLITEIIYQHHQDKREPISIKQNAFEYQITIEYLDN